MKEYPSGNGKVMHYVYKPEIIQYLLNRRNGDMIRTLLFIPYDYIGFMSDNIITLLQLSNIVEATVPSLREHIKENKIRKEHYHILKSKGYNAIDYLIKAPPVQSMSDLRQTTANKQKDY